MAEQIQAYCNLVLVVGRLQPSKHAQPSGAAAALRQYPLGFSTGDNASDLAATILRMLYIKDLRALQTLIDRTIVQVQASCAACAGL